MSVRLGNTKTSAARQVLREILAELEAGEGRRPDTARCRRARSGPSPMTILLPGQVISRKASMFFSTATRPT